MFRFYCLFNYLRHKESIRVTIKIGVNGTVAEEADSGMFV